MLQLAGEAFELHFERWIVEIALDQVHDRAAHHHRLHKTPQFGYVLRPRNAEPYRPWQFRDGAHRTDQRLDSPGKRIALARDAGTRNQVDEPARILRHQLLPAR